MSATKNELSANSPNEPASLSPLTQKAVLDDIRQEKSATWKSFKRAALWTGLGLAVFAVAPALSLGSLPVMAASILTFWNGSRMLRDTARGMSLHRTAQKVSGENFVPELKARAGRRMAQAATAATVSNNTFYATLALAVGLFIPPVAAVAGSLYGIAILGTVVTMGVADAFRGSMEAAKAVAKSTYTHRVAEGVIRPAEEALPPAFSAAPKVAPDFKAAANSNVKPDAAPVPDVAPPKTGAPKL